MNWKLTHSKRSEKQLKALDDRTRKRVIVALDHLARDPLRGKRLGPPHTAKRSWRTGDYRIIYEIKGDTLEDAGTRDVQGTLYRLFNGSAMQAGDDLKLTITGKMVGEELNNTSGVLIGIGALGVVLVLAGVWLYRRNAASQEEVELEEEEIEESSEESAESIMDAILTLDDLYQANELPEDAYMQRRSELKERLQQENIYLREEIDLQYKHEEIVGESGALKVVLNQVAKTDL